MTTTKHTRRTHNTMTIERWLDTIQDTDNCGHTDTANNYIIVFLDFDEVIVL